MRVDNNDHPQTAGILALGTAVHAYVGAVTAATVALQPLTGITFGAVYLFGSTGTGWLEQWMEDRGCSPFREGSTFAKVLKFAIAFLAGIALATASCTALATPIVFSVGLKLTTAMLATTVTIGLFARNHHHVENTMIGTEFLYAIRC
jgi:ABC-type branched-subunit amino acid transport system permease subunit